MDWSARSCCDCRARGDRDRRPSGWSRRGRAAFPGVVAEPCGDVLGGAVRGAGLGDLLPQPRPVMPSPGHAPPNRRARPCPPGQFVRDVAPRQVLGKHLGVGQQIDQADVFRLDEPSGHPEIESLDLVEHNRGQALRPSARARPSPRRPTPPAPAGSARECVRREPRSPGPAVVPSRATVCAMISSAMALCRSCRQATAKRTPGRCPGEFRGRTDHVGQVARALPGSASRARSPRVARPAAAARPGSPRPEADRPARRSRDGRRRPPRNPARVIPGRLEGKAAQDLIDVLANLLHAPAGPGPDLGRNEVEDRDAPRLGAAGDPPVQTRIVDQHDGVRPLVAKIAIRHEDQADERHQVEKHVQEPHHREVDQRVEQARAGLPPSSRRRSRRTGRPENARGANGSGWRRAGRRWALPPR